MQINGRALPYGRLRNIHFDHFFFHARPYKIIIPPVGVRVETWYNKRGISCMAFWVYNNHNIYYFLKDVKE